jgi:hypothetical protein
MKRIYVIYLMCIFVIVLFGCSQSNISNENSIVINKDTLDYNTIGISEIFSDLEIIPLETNSKCLIAGISKLIFFDNKLFILDATSKAVMVFSSTGTFIRRYGSVGSGPGEFQTPTSICINELDNTLLIYDMSTRSILIYSINGAYIKSIKIEDGLLGRDIAIKDNIIYLNTISFSKEQYENLYNIRMFNLNGKYLGGLLKMSENNLGWIGDETNIFCFSKYNDSLRFYNSISNHIYTLDQKNVEVSFTLNSNVFFSEEDVKSLFINKKGLMIHEKINMLLAAKKEITFSKYLENNKYSFMYTFMNVVIYNKHTKEKKYGRLIDDILSTNNVYNIVSYINDEYCFGFTNLEHIGSYSQKNRKKVSSLSEKQLDFLNNIDLNANPVILKFKFI